MGLLAPANGCVSVLVFRLLHISFDEVFLWSSEKGDRALTLRVRRLK